ncbi:MAG: GAF domain-containing protein [Clostridia bacterium]|nr:GAF domain-containing protein [Clostridia bacterium]
MIYDPSNGELKHSVVRGRFSHLHGSLIKTNVGITGSVFTSRQAFFSRDFSAEPLLADSLKDHVLKGWGGACIPIIAADKAVGILYIAVPLPQEINSQELTLLTSLCDMGGTAVHRLSLYEDTIRQLNWLETSRIVYMTINASLDLHVTLDILLGYVMDQLHVNATCIYLLNKPLNKLDYTAGRGFRASAAEHNSLRLGEAAPGCAALERRTVYVHNRAEAPDETCINLMEKEMFTSSVNVPLVSRGEVIGVLSVYNREQNIFKPEWINFLETLAGQAAIAVDNAKLFETMQRSNLELSMAYDATVEGWGYALDLRDEETEGHSKRVVEMTMRVFQVLDIAQENLPHVKRGALLHDIGKMGIADAILLKPGKLNEEEWEIMRQHPVYAYNMLSRIDYLRPALNIPYCHHEKYDGSGYPRGLKGEEIPLEARVFAVVDVFDALTNNRPYRSAWSREKALQYIREEKGRHFDPDVAEAFLSACG